MPLLIIIVIGIIWAGISIKESCPKNHAAFTPEEIQEMNRRMIGKSEKECQRIVKEYRK